ncbi:MAG: CotH kinase family protein [Treponema sp.]|nr:CotH kinase family protein [Spirochaetales bacterium]MDY6190028.1 CotH kinase family protein [Treponema sp.]
MKKLFNHLRLFLFLSALVMLLVSCSRSVALEEESPIEDTALEEESPIEDATLEEPSYTLNITQQPAYTVVSYNQSATLSCKAESECQPVSYQWYECSDTTGNNAAKIQDATSEIFQTPVFTQPEIRYYYCLVKDSVEEKKSDITAVAYTGLPIVKIETVDGGNPSAAKEKHNGRMYLIKNGEIIYDSGENNEFSIKVRGNATAHYPKRPYKLKLPKKANLLSDNPLSASANKDKNWVLLAGYCDKTLLRSKTGFFVSSLFNEISGNEELYVPNSEFVDVILNGDYLGNYCLTDSVKEGTDRLAINEKMSNSGGIGMVAECDRNYAGEPKWIISDVKKYPYTFKYPDAEDNDITVYSAIATFGDYVNRFEHAFYDENTSDDWRNYIDIESFARWFLAHNILANIDTNYFISKKTSDDSSKLVMGPVWDFEWSIGIGWYEGERPRPADYWCVNGWYFEKLLEEQDFIDELKSQWANLKQENPNLAAVINSKMDEFAENISISQQMNFMRWSILNQRVSVGGIPLGSYESELACDKQFMVNRIEWLDSVINAL